MPKTGKTRSHGRDLASARRTLADRLEQQLDDLTETFIDRLWDEPELSELTLPERRKVSTEIGRANLGHEIGTLRSGRLPTSCPPEAAEAARAAVGFGAPVTVILKCYRAGHAVLWEAWAAAVDELDFAAGRAQELLDHGSRFMFDYADRCSALVEQEYARERERVVRSGEQRRVQAVRDVLAGGEADATALAYDVDAQHVGVVAWGPGAEATTQSLGERLPRRAALLLSAGVESWWAWYGGPDPFTADEVETLRSTRPPPGSAICVGSAGPGPAGFRESHAEALRARSVAHRTGAPVTVYGDVALEALALADEPSARAFVAGELGPLRSSDRRSATLRRTLLCYFGAEQNAAAAAARLGVHERTVANRLRAVEAALGHYPTVRRAELEAALRLHRLLG